MFALGKGLTLLAVIIASIFAVSSTGPAYQPGDLVRIEYDGYKAVYRVKRVIGDNKTDPMYGLTAVDETGLLPSLSASESAMRPAETEPPR